MISLKEALISKDRDVNNNEIIQEQEAKEFIITHYLHRYKKPVRDVDLKCYYINDELYIDVVAGTGLIANPKANFSSGLTGGLFKFGIVEDEFIVGDANNFFKINSPDISEELPKQTRHLTIEYVDCGKSLEIDAEHYKYIDIKNISSLNSVKIENIKSTDISISYCWNLSDIYMGGNNVNMYYLIISNCKKLRNAELPIGYIKEFSIIDCPELSDADYYDIETDKTTLKGVNISDLSGLPKKIKTELVLNIPSLDNFEGIPKGRYTLTINKLKTLKGLEKIKKIYVYDISNLSKTEINNFPGKIYEKPTPV